MYHAHWGSRVLLWCAPAVSLPLCQARPGPPRCARRLACPYLCCVCSPPRPAGGVSVVRPVVACRCSSAGAPRCVPPWGRGGRGGSPSALAQAPSPPPPPQVPHLAPEVAVVAHIGCAAPNGPALAIHIEAGLRPRRTTAALLRALGAPGHTAPGPTAGSGPGGPPPPGRPERCCRCRARLLVAPGPRGRGRLG